jgi:hypothetical protein
MYHYLKWAALSLFFKRNLRYIVMIITGIVGIYLADAIYQDMAQYAVMTKKSDAIAGYLWTKWIAVILFTAMIVWAVMRLGFAQKKEKNAKRKKEKKRGREKKIPKEDPYMRRLKKFEKVDKIRSKSDIILEKRKRESK